MRQELDVWGLIYVDGWSTCIEVLRVVGVV